MKKLILVISLVATSSLAQEVRVTLSAEQYAAVATAVTEHNAFVTTHNANTNNSVKMANITSADVLKRYADRLVMIQKQIRKDVVTQKFDKASEQQKQAIEAEASKVSVSPVEESVEAPK